MENKISTNIPGLDELIGEGFPPGSITMISGPPGTGKSTMSMQYIHNGVGMGEPGIFLTLENTASEVRGYAKNFGWDFEGHEGEGKLKILDKDMFSGVDMDLGLDFGILDETIESIKAKRVVLDSVTLFNYLFRDDTSRRLHMLRFMDLIKKHNCTTIMTSEFRGNFPDIRYSEEHFLSDGVIFLFWNMHGGENKRCIWVVKLKGSAVDIQVRAMEITDQGIVVYPTEKPGLGSIKP